MPQSDQCKTWKRNFHKQKSYDFFHEACRYGVLYRLDYGGVSRGGFRQCLAILVTNCEKSIQHTVLIFAAHFGTYLELQKQPLNLTQQIN